jgi:hypothetical protein
VNTEQVNRALERRRLTVPTLAVGSRPIGSALHAQLQPLTDDLTGEVIDNCGHVIPLDQPEKLAAIIQRFLHSSLPRVEALAIRTCLAASVPLVSGVDVQQRLAS